MSARVVLAIALCAGCAGDARAQRTLEGAARDVDVSIPFVVPATGTFEWSVSFAQTGADFIRLRLETVRVDPAVPFRVVISGMGGAVETFTEATLPTGRPFWTKLIPGDNAKVTVEGRPAGFRIKVVRIAYQRDGINILSLIGDDDRKEFWEIARSDAAVAAAGKSIVKLSILTPAGPAACTGFMLGPDLLLTNQHCIAARRDCQDDNTVALFGFEADQNGAVSIGEQVSCIDLLDSDPELDFALIRLAGAPGAPAAWGSLRVAAGAPAAGDLRMIQHPGGSPKRIAFPPNCKVLDVKAEGRDSDRKVDLTHDCDCEEGASGSPLLNASFEVVALHRRGKTTSGPYFDRNRAVRIQEICPRIKAFLPSLVCAPAPGPQG